jgi:hypothetical protein
MSGCATRRFLVALAVLVSLAAWGRGAPSPVTGRIAHLVIRGDLDSVAMMEDVLSWVARRDSSLEALALIEMDAQHARPDLAVRIARAIEALDMPTAVHFGVRRPVAPAVLMIALASDRAFVGRAGGVAGERAHQLPDLCEDVASGWPGRQEQAVSEGLARRLVDARVADVMIAPLGDLFVDASFAVSRERTGEQVVWMTDATTWQVRVTRAQLIGLRLCEGADSAGDIFRACGLRVTRRDREEVSSGLSAARASAAAMREDLRPRMARLEVEVRSMRSLPAPEFKKRHEQVQRDLLEAQRGLDAMVSVMSRYPELMRFEPPWARTVAGDAEEWTKRWAKEVEALGEQVDRIRVSVEAMDQP